MDNISKPEIKNISDDADIELVKSLMADLTDDDILSEPTTQDALILPEITPAEPDTPEPNPIVNVAPSPDSIDDVLDDIFEMAIDDETLGDDDSLEIDAGVESLDASISSLLEIAAEAEQDAQSSDAVAEPLPDPSPEVLDVMPTQEIDLQDGLAAIEAETEIEDIDSLFSDSLISAVEASHLAPPEPEFEPTPTPALAIEALAAQSFSIEDLIEAESTPDETSIEELTTPDTASVEDALPAPSVDEAILPEPEDAPAPSSQTTVRQVEAQPLTLPDPAPVPTPALNTQTEPAPEVLVAEASPEPVDAGSELEANPTIDIAPTAALTPEKESPEMTKAAVNDSILDEVTESAASGAFASLSELVEAQTEFEESGPRIGDLVQEALRPMLKEWLDEHLKSIVERAVQKEVKRISSGK